MGLVVKGQKTKILKCDQPYDLRAIRTSSVYIKKNQYLKEDTLFIIGSNNTDKTIKRCRPGKKDKKITFQSRDYYFNFGSNSTCIYDGGKFIYIFGGYKIDKSKEGNGGGGSNENNDELKKIVRFNLTNQLLDTNYSHLSGSRYYSQGCYDGHRYFYLFGGLNQDHKIQLNIERFDTVTKKSEIILEIPTKIRNPTNYSVAEIIYHNNHLYFSVQTTFYKLSLDPLQPTQLLQFSIPSYLAYLYLQQNQFIGFYFDTKEKVIKVYCELLDSFQKEYQSDLKFKFIYSFQVDEPDLIRYRPAIIMV
eukprot:gene4141-5181_t